MTHCPTLDRDGLLVIDFPRDLHDLMGWHVGQVIGGRRDLAALTAAVQSLDDATFVDRFHKAFRMFPDSIAELVVAWLERTLRPFFEAARIGVNSVSADERRVNPQLRPQSYDLFWRCVRPGKPDVGQAHIDAHFWDLARTQGTEGPVPFDYNERWKLWIPLLGCVASNSIEVVPGSHREAVGMATIETAAGPRPALDPDWLAAHRGDFICPFDRFDGRALLFHDRLVHRGPPNNTKELRISAELTILVQQ